ncbi:hypothetical protein B0H19DRAFT_1059797 [Mycena capillaripes]|nr:hypothetical protein B0H19DRAFT_1059797 [Mycena capillaripes]
MPANLLPWATSLTHLGLSHDLLLEPIATLAALPALSHFAIDWEPLRYTGCVGFETAPRLPYVVIVASSPAEASQWWALRFLRDGDCSGDPLLYIHMRFHGDGRWGVLVLMEGNFELREVVLRETPREDLGEISSGKRAIGSRIAFSSMAVESSAMRVQLCYRGHGGRASKTTAKH